MKTPLLAMLAAALHAAAPARGATPHYSDYLIPDATLSPNRAYAVLVPIYNENADAAPDARRNGVIATRSGRRIATLAGDPPAYDRDLNHHGTGEARWSADSSLLLWKVDGKWNPDALEIVRIAPDGEVRWQLDLLRVAQQALLDLTRKAEPQKYAAAKKENAGSGRAFPDGFTVDVSAARDRVALPLAIHADLTANPKGIEDYPANLDSYLDAEVAEDGRFVVKGFHLGARPPQP